MFLQLAYGNIFVVTLGQGGHVMNYVYASRMGKTEKLIQKLAIHAMKIENGTEKAEGDFILFTYTDGNGIVPKAVESFLELNGGRLKGVIAGGSKERHAATFGWAGDVIAEKYHVPCLYKVDGEGSEEDVVNIKKVIR